MSKVLRVVGVIAGAVAVVATAGAALGFGAAIASIGIGSATAIASVAALVSAGAGMAATLLQKAPPARGAVSQVVVTPDPPQPYAMGEGYIGGVVRYDRAYGGTVDKVPNPYRWQVQVYSGAGPVDSISPRFDYGAVASYYNTYLYTSTQLGACPESAALAPNWSGAPNWTASSKLSGQAAIGWNFRFDKKGKRFASGIPLTGAYGKWVKVYDPRLDSTFPGGSGPHRLGTESTYAWSENPALHALTYAFGRYQNGKKVMGIGLPADGIDIAAIAAWANVCDANGWTIFGRVFEPGDRWANLKDICIAGGCEPVFAGGVLSWKYWTPQVSLTTVTEADISDDAMSVTTMQPYSARINTIIPKYIDPNSNWEMVAAQQVQDATFLADDGEERKQEFAYNLVKKVRQATQLAGYRLRDSRETSPISITCKPHLRAYRPGECITLDLPSLGLTGDAIILKRKINPENMTVEFTLMSETASKHAYALGLTGTAPNAPTSGQTGAERDDIADAVATATDGVIYDGGTATV